MKNSEEKANEQIVYFDRVRQYIASEYNEELIVQMNLSKHINVCLGYLRNCYSLGKTIPEATALLVKYLRSTK